jgi:hypothetical protein
MEVPIMSTYLTLFAADKTAAAFGAVPAGLPLAQAVCNHDIADTEMTKVFGQARRPRGIPPL